MVPNGTHPTRTWAKEWFLSDTVLVATSVP